MSVKGDRSRVDDFTRYEKNYTKIFGDWVETRTTVPKLKKKEKVKKNLK
tara:strand:+ start:359 stop:505 length:147 start_codon:yes stop_codon:yes gene_type:complete